MTLFRWNDWNLEHATRHGCQVEEIEAVVRREVRANRYQKSGERKFRVIGRGIGQRPLRVIFVFDDADRKIVYVIHAMPITTRGRSH